MTKKICRLEFLGYFRDRNLDVIENQSGVYCVYTYKQGINTLVHSSDIVELIYIGEAGDAKDRIRTHDRRDEWEEYLGGEQGLCYSFTPIKSEEDRKRVEAALIFRHKPRFNEKHKDSFGYPITHIKTSGTNVGLEADFTVP